MGVLECAQEVPRLVYWRARRPATRAAPDIFEAVVDKQRRLCGLSDTRDGVAVDPLVGLGDTETV